MARMTQVQSAYERLRMMIITEKIPNGRALSEQEYADAFGMSRTPIREAFRRLHHEGLIEIIPHRGTYVRTLSSSEVIHNYEIAEALEGMIVFLATANITDRDLKELQICIDAMAEAQEQHEVERWVEMDEAFHRLIFARCENAILVRQRLDLQGQIFRSRLLKTMPWLDKKTSNEEHRRILAALRAHDPEQARTQIHRHWERVRSEFRTFA
jgi:DNA-binding GntR family transcriptional regulator